MKTPAFIFDLDDAVSGIDAAKSAGMFAVGIGDSAAYGRADLGVQSLNELLDLECEQLF